MSIASLEHNKLFQSDVQGARLSGSTSHLVNLAALLVDPSCVFNFGRSAILLARSSTRDRV